MKNKKVEPICQNCEYFYKKGCGYTTCNNKNYGRCSCPKFRYEEPKRGENDNLVYSDYESYAAGFDVGIEFGCKHFKPKREVSNND